METIKQKTKALTLWWKKTEQPGIVDILLMSILLTVTTLCFLYGDVLVTIEHSFNFLDSVFSGKFLDFYQVAIENSRFGHPAVYEFPIYVVFAIWNLPVYLLTKIFHFDYLSSLPCLLWAKLMMVFFTFLAAKILMKIGEELHLTKERCKWVAFFFLTASTVVIPVFMIVQYDIISIVFMLLGIYSYMKDDTKGFIFWFILANTMKLFAVFIFIPLVLLKEKRLIQICLYTLSGLIGILICKIFYHSDAAYQASTKGFSGTMMDRLQASSIKWQYDGFVLPLFVLLMVGVCIFCYWKKIKTAEERNSFAIYIPLVVFCGFVALVPFNPYWMILAAPYMVLMPFITPKHLKLNILLETAIGLILVWTSIMINYPVFGINILDRMLLAKFMSATPLPRYTYLSQLFIDFGVGNFINFAAAILVACVLAMVLINYPKREYLEQDINKEPLERGVIWLRGAVPCIFSMLMMLCYVLPAPGIAYSSASDMTEDSTKDLLTTDTNIIEVLKFDKDIEIKKIEIGFTFQEFQWIDSSIVEVSLTTDDGQTVIWKENKPANMLKNQIVEFDTGKILLKRGTEYELKITGKNGEGMPLYIKYSTDHNEFDTYENGILKDGDIYLNIYGTWEE